MIQEIRVAIRAAAGVGPDTRGDDVLAEIKRLGVASITGVKTVRVYRLEGLSPNDAHRFAKALFVEEVNQEWTQNAPLVTGAAQVVEVAYKPGVMNPEAASIMKAARDLGFTNLAAADSSTEYAFFGTPTADQIGLVLSRLLMNRTVERVVTEAPATLVISGEPGAITIVPIRSLGDDGLIDLSKDKLFLNLEEMRAIQAHFREIKRDPTDGELEAFGVAWSQHCGHKTFKAKLIVDGFEKKPLIARIKKGVERFSKGVLSAFEDNSGVAEFYDGLAVCGKVETHNSPSAIEPYGGAATGSGGVFRDIMGTGQGAKVIASTDMFCFAQPDLDPAELPPGCLHPHYLLRRVVGGVRDYGNRMGIPTANGSIHFHEDFRAKPTVIVGSYGIIPEALCQKGKPRVGDRVIALGGRTGRDGIHGATFSSGEMTERTISVNASAVQIGNAIEEKRMSDAILACRDGGFIRAITDCGAGGFSSAIGEMGSEIGVRIELEKAPLKYSGLAPWEIWVSESQERMVLAVPRENVSRVLKICSGLNVEATELGEFTGDRRLVVAYNGASVCDLDMQFLHHGLPQQILTGAWKSSTPSAPRPPLPDDWGAVCHAVLRHPNVCSKEPIVRQYDHSVQGTNALPPFTGDRDQSGPQDALVLTPVLGKPYGLVISHGLNPILMRIDPYWGAVWAATEAMANLVAVGGNPEEAWLIDNFIWPVPDEESLGALDRAVDACVDVMNAFKIPFISGKDSLSSTYRGKDGTVIQIPPVLCISAFGRIPDVATTMSSDFKEVGSTIMLIGRLAPWAMGGSAYYDVRGIVDRELPQVDLKEVARRFRKVHQLIKSGAIMSCHDISEGGLFVALAEMCFGGNVGADIELLGLGDWYADALFFNEMAGCFIAEVPRGGELGLLNAGIYAAEIGQTIRDRVITMKDRYRTLFSVDVAELKGAWQAPMKEVFHG